MQIIKLKYHLDIQGPYIFHYTGSNHSSKILKIAPREQQRNKEKKKTGRNYYMTTRTSITPLVTEVRDIFQWFFVRRLANCEIDDSVQMSISGHGFSLWIQLLRAFVNKIKTGSV